MAHWEYTETELWRFGEDDISIYHVFALVSAGQCVLAFAEARCGDGADAGTAHHICMRKSTDGGKSFAPGRMVLKSNGTQCYANPTPLYDAQTGRLFLAYAENPDNRSTRLFLLHSDDLGEHWSAPRELTPDLSNARALSFHLPGPGHGLQLQKSPYTGRLLFPIWHRLTDVSLPREQRGYCVSLLYSDDHGATWQHTHTLGHALYCNESRLCETQGELLWTLRSFGTQHAMATSRDGGISWSEPSPMPLPAANACDAGLLSLCANGEYADTVLFSRISSTEKKQRRDMEICISTNGGRTFSDTFRLPVGDAMPGYSDLCLIDGDEPVVGLVHCRHNHVLFSRISLQTLTGGKYEHTVRHVWQEL